MGLEALLGPTATHDRSADASSPTTLQLTDLVAGMYHRLPIERKAEA